MLSATAALDAPLGRRATAAVLAAALQAIFYWLIVHESIEPTAPQRSSPPAVTIFDVPRRPRSTTLLRQRPWRALPRPATLKSRSPVRLPPAQPITLPQAAGPFAHPPIDWQQAVQREVHELASRSHARKMQFGFPQMPRPPPPTPRFGWDYAHTHRLEPLPGGGTIINLTDRCALVVYVIPIPVCKIGHIPVNDHLFDDMRDRRNDSRGGLP